MATITRRATGWFVQIRRKGFTPEYKTLRTKGDAERWARDREAMIDRGEQPASPRDLNGQSLGDLIRRYMEEVTPRKLSAESERLRLSKMLRAPLCAVSLSNLSAAPVAAYRDERAAVVKAGTVAREMSLLHNVIDIAQKEWGIALPTNVVAQVRRLPVKNARERRLKEGELDRLLTSLQKTRNKEVRQAVLLAIETGLRRSELLNLEWSNIDRNSRTAYIPHTKTGYARTIPLTDQSIALIERLEGSGNKLFSLSPIALRLAWNRVRIRAGIPDLRFHDLRHEAISRFSELGLSIVELSVISGHRDPRMLFRYAHLNPATLAKKLAGRSWAKEIEP